MLGNSIKYAEKAEESRQVGKIKKVLITKASEFLPSYYAVCYYGKSSSDRLLKPEEYRKDGIETKLLKLISLLAIELENVLVIFLYFG